MTPSLPPSPRFSQTETRSSIAAISKAHDNNKYNFLLAKALYPINMFNIAEGNATRTIDQRHKNYHKDSLPYLRCCDG